MEPQGGALRREGERAMRWSPGSLVFAFAALFLGAAGAAPPDAAGACAGALPPSLAPPPRHALAFALAAEGVQIYACTSSPAGVAWTFQAPEARLLDGRGQPAGKHYAGPTWEGTDGSKVVGTPAERATPDPTAIPWLLLKASAHQGAGRMAAVAFVQRVQTTGGVAPADGCGPASAGTVARVPYRAVYCFYRAGEAGRD
jgi:hypothetical protein